jgi:hypothetical protein
MNKIFKVGAKVQLFPGDTHKKVAEILDVDEYGWTFKMLEGTSENWYNNVGDTIFYSHTKIVMKLL